MSGFLKSVAQIYPDKKIASVKRKSVLKRFNEARFAKGANRDYMESIEFTLYPMNFVYKRKQYNIKRNTSFRRVLQKTKNQLQ